MPTDNELQQMYGQSYFTDGGAWVCGTWRGGYADNEVKLRLEAGEALRDLGRAAPGRLLEVGPAGGFFLDEARKAGYEVMGVEINPEMAEFGRERLNLDLRCGIFEQIGLDGTFDVIVAQDVLEHTRDPLAFMRRVAALLAPGGTFFIRGPLEDDFRERIYRTTRSALRRGTRVVEEAPFHLQGFTRGSFSTLMRRAGLSVVTFKALGTAPRWNEKGVWGTLTGAVESIAYVGDRLCGGGDFMRATVAVETRASPAPSSLDARAPRKPPSRSTEELAGHALR
jgi:SAM-dependent methyltransferase